MFPGARVLRRRGGIDAPGAARLGRVACASTSCPRRQSAGGGAVLEERWGSRRRERDRGPVLLQPAAPASSRPQPGLRAGWPAGELRNRFSSASPLSLPLTPGRQKGEDGAGTPGRPRDRSPHPRPGLRRSARLPHLALRRVCQASPRVSARPGRGRREGGRGAGGGGGRGRAEVTPGSCCHCPAPCHSARAGPGIGSLAPLRTHLAFTYPGRAVER